MASLLQRWAWNRKVYVSLVYLPVWGWKGTKLLALLRALAVTVHWAVSNSALTMKFSGANEVWSACHPGRSGHSSFLGDLIISQDWTQSEKARKMDNMFGHYLSTQTHIRW